MDRLSDVESIGLSEAEYEVFVEAEKVRLLKCFAVALQPKLVVYNLRNIHFGLNSAKAREDLFLESFESLITVDNSIVEELIKYINKHIFSFAENLNEGPFIDFCFDVVNATGKIRAHIDLSMSLLAIKYRYTKY
jgi:hypothetical protein